MNLTAWRWSIGLQCTSLAMIGVFFAVLLRSTRRAEVRSWALAWAMDVVALGVSLLYWSWQPGPPVFNLVAALFMASKTAFVLLAIDGASRFRRQGSGVPAARAAFLLGGYALTAVLVPSIEVLGLVQNLVLGLLFALGSLQALRKPRDSALIWLGTAFAIRAILSFTESAVFGFVLAPHAMPSLVQGANFVLSGHSFIDTAAEWLLALAFVLALSDRAQGELMRYNQDLLAAQDHLRRLADRDPLTALGNRRSLPEVFRAVQPQGALLLFFDLDDFKGINDTLGHQAGDACLKRFATSLGECFRPGDALVRYAGDEFLVVASGLDPASALERVERLRERLRASSSGEPAVSFSVGLAELPPGGQPDAALRAADESMYGAKAARHANRN